VVGGLLADADVVGEGNDVPTGTVVVVGTDGDISSARRVSANRHTMSAVEPTIATTRARVSPLRDTATVHNASKKRKTAKPTKSAAMAHRESIDPKAAAAPMVAGRVLMAATGIQAGGSRSVVASHPGLSPALSDCSGLGVCALVGSSASRVM
jgi:hypothetical protein